MSDQITLEKQELPAGNPAETAVKTEDGPAACPMQGKGWFKGALGIAICCAAPLLLFAAISSFGLSWGETGSGVWSIVALLACPVAVFSMMRVTMKDKKKD